MFSAGYKAAQSHKTSKKVDKHRWNSLLVIQKAHLAKSQCPLSFSFFFITQCSALLLSVQSTKPQQQSLPNKSLQPISDGCVFEKQKLRTYLCVNQCRVLALWFFPLPPDNALMFCWSFCTHTHTHCRQECTINTRRMLRGERLGKKKIKEFLKKKVERGNKTKIHD